MTNILPISLLGHAVLWIYLFMMAKNVPRELVNAAYGQLHPAVLYAGIIIVGHSASYLLIAKSRPAVLALLVAMLYSALVLLITVIRLANIHYL